MSSVNTLPRVKLLYVETFGCQMNVSDSEKIISLLKSSGYQPTPDSSSADLILLNTCSVRAKAEEKVYQHLARYKYLKQEKRVLLGVGGCVAQQEGERLLERIPHLDLVFGTHNLHRLPEIVMAAEQGERPAAVDFVDTETRRDLFPQEDREGGVTRFVTIMQGCDNFCSYCVVPYVRGREISRRAGEILDEVSALVSAGVKEVTLLGQNVNSYGLKDSGQPDFARLLRRLADIDGLERIRFTTSHPKDISRPLIACFEELPKVCSHIHLPAQSGSDEILARMNRGYTRGDYLAVVSALKAARPNIQITGDFIVGFPGETEQDFLQTLSLMEEVQYAELYAFIYSPRSETAAAAFPDPVSKREKKERLERLLVQQRLTTRRRDESFVGTRQPVLVEGISRRGNQLTGRTSGNRVVNFPGDAGLVGKVVDVTITKANSNSLLGELAQPN